MRKGFILYLFCLVSCVIYAQVPVIRLMATDFRGGGLTPALSLHYEKYDVNAIYPLSTGDKSRMIATFQLESEVRRPKLQLEAHANSETDMQARIEIKVNGKSIYEGTPQLDKYKWDICEIDIPEGILKIGDNEIELSNIMAKELPGNSNPWLMINCVAIGEDDFDMWETKNIFKKFHVTLPEKKQSFFANNNSFKGFKLRGLKGWNWTPEQTLEEIPHMKAMQLNFFMNCYTSMFDYPNYNEWWVPFDEEFKADYEKIVQSCKENGIEFCFALNPNFIAEKAFDYDNKKHVEILWKHYKWMANLGVNWFSVCLDDIGKGLDASGQARFVNLLLKRLRKMNPNAQMILCPSIYASSYIVGGVDNDQYLKTLARDLNPDVYCFWTGDYFCGPISTEKAIQMKNLLKHRLIIWDNYPVNDGAQSMNLGPVVLRDASLVEVCDGYMANPMRTQNQIGRIPIYTCAEFAWNPERYNPMRSIGQAILHQCETREQAEVLKELVDVYYGFLLEQSKDYWYVRNTARSTFEKLTALTHGKVAAVLFVEHLEEILNKLEKTFPNKYQAERETVKIDLDWMKRELKVRYPEY